MLAQLFFLILVFMTMSFGTKIQNISLSISLESIFIYLCTLFALYLLGEKARNKRRLSPHFFAANLLLLLFFAYFHIYSIGSSLFSGLYAQVMHSFVTLILYFSGILVFQYFAFNGSSRLNHALNYIRFYAPFTLPLFFLLFTLDSLEFYAISQTATLITSLFLFILFLGFVPFFMQKLWGCKDLPKSTLKEEMLTFVKI